MSILEASAEAWWRLSSMIGQLLVRLETGLPPVDVIIATFAELRTESEKIGLSLTTRQIDRIKEYAKSNAGKVPIQEFGEKFRQLVLDMHERALDELHHRFFIVIPSEMIQYYKHVEPIFGDSVEANFPNISEDLSEASKCLGVGRATACVFHLMRALESVVVYLGEKIGATVISSDNATLEWGKILNNIKIRIEAMPRGRSKENWAEAFSMLLHVKTAWRNPTMHPRQTYTVTEARDIFAAVSTFVRALAEL